MQRTVPNYLPKASADQLRLGPEAGANRAISVIVRSIGRVDKRDSPGAVIVIQAGICNGDQRGTKPDVERRVGVL